MTAMTDDTLPVTPRALRDEMIALVVIVALLAIVPWSGIYLFFVMQALCFALLACAFNLLIGYGGLLSFGHAMFLGTAGYCTAHALKVWGVSPEIGILVGVAGAAALSVVTGFVSIRRQGIYFSMITLALSQLLYFVYLQTPFTHGEDGIQGIPQGHLFWIFDLARLQDRPIQAARLHPLRHAGGFCRVAKGVRRTECLAHRRALDHVGRDR